MGLTATGVGSGLDVTGLVSQLMEVEKQPLLKLASRQASYQAKISALGLVKGSLSSLQTAVAALKDPAKFSATKVMVGAGAGFTATSSASAATGSYAVQVEQLATQQLTSLKPTAKKNEAGDTVGYALRLSRQVPGADASTEWNFSGTSLNAVRDAINADSSLGVTATLIDADGVDGVDSLSLKANDTGSAKAFSTIDVAAELVAPEQAASADAEQKTRFAPTASADGSLSVTINSTTYKAANFEALTIAINADSKLAVTATVDQEGKLLLTGDAKASSFTVVDDNISDYSTVSPTQDAKDAMLSIDGVSVTRSSNTISDLVAGVTFNLTGTTDAAVDLTVSRNDAVATSAINAFVSAYNSFLTTTREQTAYDAASNKASTLTGDATLRRMQDQLRTLITAEIDGLGGVRRLNDIGVSFQADGKLSVDSGKLSAALADPARDVARFFVGNSGNGFAATLSNRLDSFLKVGGALATRTDALAASVKLLEKKSEAFDLRLAMIEARYMKQFSALDSILSNMTATSSFLTQQIDGWNATANSAKA